MSGYFKKGDYSTGSYFKKGDLSQKHIGNFGHHGMVHAFVKAGDFDLRENRKAGNNLEKTSK